MSNVYICTLVATLIFAGKITLTLLQNCKPMSLKQQSTPVYLLSDKKEIELIILAFVSVMYFLNLV
jgi:hypothetical protein